MTLQRTSNRIALLGGALLLVGGLAACGVEDTTPVAAHPQVETSADAAAARAGVTFLLDCVDEPVSKPTSFTVACADGNQSLTDLEWSNWGADEAIATGTVVANNCDPSCAEGTDVKARVRVTASDLVDGEASATYGKLTIKVTGDLPEGMDPEQEITLRTTDPVDPEMGPGS
ncbi:hypothetical protein [Nocardioides sp. LML1-1-1.1]|uniref:hypothetical protein n=1 Tax=Nocardioides sp. LML1-1-1.1 TaxID=3135248 RepID=UPI00341F1E55